MYATEMNNCRIFSLSGVAILVTGGNAGTSAEVLLEDGTPWCSLPGLPEDRHGHTQSGLVTCGGLYTLSSCVTFTDGGWSWSHNLTHERYEHSSWTSPVHGTILIGGDVLGYTTEMLTDTGVAQQSFPLKYRTR